MYFEYLVSQFLRLIPRNGVPFLQVPSTPDSCRPSLKFRIDFFSLNSCLSRQLPDLPILGSLLAGLSLPVQENGAETSPSDSSDAFLWSLPPWTAKQLAPIIQGTSKSASLADVTGKLQELDEISKRRVDILQHFTVSVDRWFFE